MRIKYVSYYTPRYEKMANRLMKSMDVCGLDFDIQDIPEFSDQPGQKFLPAVRFKPAFILNMMEKWPEYDAIVWTDADSEFKSAPKLLQSLECDVAVRYRECFELLSGTMFWRNCQKCQEFLPVWIEAVESTIDQPLPCPEQQVLQKLIQTSGLDVYRLPEEYVYVAPMAGKPEEALRERNNLGRVVTPVIYHHQASRTMRTT